MNNKTKQKIDNNMNRIQEIVDAIGIDPKRSEEIGAELTSIFSARHTDIVDIISGESLDANAMQDIFCECLEQMINTSMEQYHDPKETMYAGIAIGGIVMTAVMMGTIPHIDIFRALTLHNTVHNTEE